MSRVGNKPIPIPDELKVDYHAGHIVVEGKSGRLERTIHPMVDMEIKDNVITVIPKKDTRQGKAFQGLVRSLVSNMVTGIHKGFERTLEIHGIGYRAELNGKTLVLHLGFSNPVNFEIPEDIGIVVEKNNIIKLSGIDKEKVGHIAASIKRLRPVEPYKGKGVKYSDEVVMKKAGKAGAK